MSETSQIQGEITALWVMRFPPNCKNKNYCKQMHSTKAYT